MTFSRQVAAFSPPTRPSASLMKNMSPGFLDQVEQAHSLSTAFSSAMSPSGWAIAARIAPLSTTTTASGSSSSSSLDFFLSFSSSTTAHSSVGM